MRKRLCWFDTDMGSDDRLAILMALGSGRFKPLGLSTVFGNVSVKTATQNACETLSAFGYTKIPVFAGAHLPLNGILPLGDNAYGEDGAGGQTLIDSGREIIKPQSIPDGAQHRLIDAVMKADPKSKVTIFATGPLTNIARAIFSLKKNEKDFEAFKEKTQLIIMGGSLEPGPLPNPPHRIGNITEYAEFNMHMDPAAAQIVFDSGLDCHVMSMDATQYTDLNPERQQIFLEKIPGKLGEKLLAMIRTVEPLDIDKFGAKGSFLHDPQVVAYALDPEAYWTATCKSGGLYVEKNNPPREFDPASHYGEILIEKSPDSRITFIDAIAKDPDEIFGLIVDNIAKIAPRYEP